MNKTINQEPCLNMSVEDFFDGVIYDGIEGGIIYADLVKGIDAEAKYLVPLGLMCGTEFLGKLMPILSDHTDRDSCRDRFMRFLCRMDRPSFRYRLFNDMLISLFGKKNDIYSVFRCGIVHEYFVKPALLMTDGRTELKLGSVIARDTVGEGSIAIGQLKDGRLGMAYKDYFEDFVELLNFWREKIFKEKDKVWLKAFKDGLKSNDGDSIY
ncbi:hypothetical protein JW710_03785 [Candidatus Dojkabacteria bacterium]|nr:hypothetical protein [Candidatus Dojkabacteria bacterium]